MRLFHHGLAGLAASLALAVTLAACGGKSGHSNSGGAPPPAGGTPTGGTPTGGTPTGGTPTGGGGTSTSGSTGSPYWYVGNQLGNAYKTHTSSEATLAAQVLTLVNQERASQGLAPLAQDAQAERAAKVHAEDQVGRSYFSHITPEGWDPGQRLQMTGASGHSGWGENIASGQQTAAAVMAAWMGSTGHRTNILNATFTHLGVGVVESQRLWVQVFLRR